MATHFEPGMMQAPQYTSQTLEHLGLVAGMVDELGLVEQIDRLIPQPSEPLTVSMGQAIKAMILNGLGFTQRALYLMPHFFQDKPVRRLLGEGVGADQLNDDKLGRALDAVYTYGADKLYAQLAAHSVNQLGLLCQFAHLDSTSFHTDGQYNDSSGSEEGVIHITKGYSRDHRPDLNQVVLQLISEQQAGIPLRMAALSGNSSDKTDFRETLTGHVEQLQADVGLEYVVADSALYTAESLQAMTGYHWISRVPETLSLARHILQAVAADLMADPAASAFRSLSVSYADMRQRWVVVYSPEARQRAQATLQRQCLKLSEQEYKRFKRLCTHDFACEADARQALADFRNTLKMTVVHDAQIVKIAHFKGKGRPAKGREPDHSIYHIDGGVASDTHEWTRRLQRKSCFILASNQSDQEALPDQALITHYKQQQTVERGFRFLKDPWFMASTLFLKSPKRIMALMAVMTLCLLVYAALEYRIRQTLTDHRETFPDQLGKPSAKPTARWVFQCFAGIHVLVIAQQQELVLNMNEQHLSLLSLLGEHYQKLYAGVG